MHEFLVTMDIAFPKHLTQASVESLLAEEAYAAAPFFASGEFARAWRSYGEHAGNHGHVALWRADSEHTVHAAYRAFPLVKMGFAHNLHIVALGENPNDPQVKARKAAENKWGDHEPIQLTWDSLYPLIMAGPTQEQHRHELSLVGEIAPGVTIHVHPHSENPRTIHFMVDDEKVAEIGEDKPDMDVATEGAVAGFIDFLAEWLHRPIGHQMWKDQIAADNGLVHASYADAKAAPRQRFTL